MLKLSLIIPAYNEEKAIGALIEKIDSQLKDFYSRNQYEIIVIDDGSTDKTAQIAQSYNATVLKHPYNIGYGAAVKKGLRQAQGEWFLMLDADGQHDPEYIPKFLELAKDYDMVVGNRCGWRQVSLHRKIANIGFNRISSWLVGKSILDLTSGFRLIKASIAKRFIFLLPNTFSSSSTLTMAVFRSGYSVKYLPIQIQPRLGKSKISLIKDGLRFLTIMVKIAVFFAPLRVFIPISLFCFATGISHAIYRMGILQKRYTEFTFFFLTFGLLIFLMGLIAEQITQLRFERNEKEAT